MIRFTPEDVTHNTRLSSLNINIIPRISPPLSIAYKNWCLICQANDMIALPDDIVSISTLLGLTSNHCEHPTNVCPPCSNTYALEVIRVRGSRTSNTTSQVETQILKTLNILFRKRKYDSTSDIMHCSKYDRVTFINIYLWFLSNKQGGLKMWLQKIKYYNCFYINMNTKISRLSLQYIVSKISAWNHLVYYYCLTVSIKKICWQDLIAIGNHCLYAQYTQRVAEEYGLRGYIVYTQNHTVRGYVEGPDNYIPYMWVMLYLYNKLPINLLPILLL